MEVYYGIVEDIQDPQELGRVRVRVYSIHNKDTVQIPTADLPWAAVMQPTTSAANSGVGTTPRLLQGSLVILFFTDEGQYQYPVIMGSLPSNLSANFMNIDGTDIPWGTDGYGFQDPGKVYPSKRLIGENDISRLAKDDTYTKHKSYIQRKFDRLYGLVKANAPKLSTIVEAVFSDEFYTEDTYDEPPIMDDQAVTYPSNQVRESASGIVEEWDDGNTRKHNYHPSGTYEEIIADGSRTLKIVGSDHEIVLEGKNLYITGDYNVTVIGNKRELVTGDYILEVEGNMSVETKQSKQEKVGIDTFQEVGGNQVENIGGNRTTTVTQNEILTVGKDRITQITEDELRNVTLTESVTIGEGAVHQYFADLAEVVGGEAIRKVTGDLTQQSEATASYGQKDLVFVTSDTAKMSQKDLELASSNNETVTVGATQDITAAKTQYNNNVHTTEDFHTATITLNTHVHPQDPDSGGDTQVDTGVGK